MNHPDYFRNNLQTLKEESGLSITKFFEQLDMSRSTVQSVMGQGQTTLDAACRIANALHLPLCTMTDGALSPERAAILHSLLIGVGNVWIGGIIKKHRQLNCDKSRF